MMPECRDVMPKYHGDKRGEFNLELSFVSGISDVVSY